jgi:uncharacterized protein (DUF1697 family)
VTAYVALLRAVNVGGTGKLPMTDLKRLGEEAGFAKVRTFIASGNLLFESDLDEQEVKSAIEDRLEDYAGKRIPVLVRTHAEMAAVAAANPFPDEPPNWTVAIFLDEAPGPDALASVTHKEDEKLALGKREIYVAYGAGMGRSKLRVPAGAGGTARNMNSVRKLAELSAPN